MVADDAQEYGIIGKAMNLAERLAADGRREFPVEVAELGVGPDLHRPRVLVSSRIVPSPIVRPRFLSCSTALSLACQRRVQK